MNVRTVWVVVVALILSWIGCDDVDRTPAGQGDSGIDVGAVVARGLAGTSRPQGDGYDIGAYEYHESE